MQLIVPAKSDQSAVVKQKREVILSDLGLITLIPPNNPIVLSSYPQRLTSKFCQHSSIFCSCSAERPLCTQCTQSHTHTADIVYCNPTSTALITAVPTRSGRGYIWRFMSSQTLRRFRSHLFSSLISRVEYNLETNEEGLAAVVAVGR